MLMLPTLKMGQLPLHFAIAFCVYNINLQNVCCSAPFTAINQLYVLQLQAAETLQSSSTSGQDVVDVSSFFFPLPSTTLTSAVAPTNALGSRTEVKTWHFLMLTTFCFIHNEITMFPWRPKQMWKHAVYRWRACQHEGGVWCLSLGGRRLDSLHPMFRGFPHTLPVLQVSHLLPTSLF